MLRHATSRLASLCATQLGLNQLYAPVTATRLLAATTGVRFLYPDGCANGNVFQRGLSESATSVIDQTRLASGHIAPHGGTLVDLMVRDMSKQASLVAECQGRVIQCSDRNACDIELLGVGGFSPLMGPMVKEDYEYCVENMRLPNGELLFGLPVVLDTNDETLREGHKCVLMYNGLQMGVIEIESRFEPNKAKEARNCYLTSSLEHPGVKMIAMERGKYYIGGKLHVFSLPTRYPYVVSQQRGQLRIFCDFSEFPCATPMEVRASLPANRDVVAFQCRNPVHRAHYELFTRALDAANVGSDAVCLVHPTCGPTQGDDIPGIVRYHTYEVLKEELNNDRIKWAYLPYSMHMAGTRSIKFNQTSTQLLTLVGPREAIQHMLIRKNYGCTHFIIGRDMAGSKSCISGEDFYGPYDAQEMAQKYSDELGVQTVPSLNVVYTEEKGYVTVDIAEKQGLNVKKLSGTKFRKMLRSGEDIPEWFAFKSVVKVLKEHTARQ